MPKSRAPGRGWHMIDEIELVPLMAEHGRWRRLCARLEAIADALPEMPSLIELAALRSQLRDAFADEDVWIFPFHAMFEAEAARPQVGRLLDRLRDRRAERAVEAQDLADMIAAEQPGGRTGAETLGYMLRSVFVSCEDSIALEMLALLFIAPERLTGAARALLVQQLEQDQLRR